MDCKNCSLSIQTHHNYCPACGAKVIKNRLTIKSLFSHFSEQFLNYDNKFLKTFNHLTTKPEAVIGCYVDGTRKKYVNVISYFALALTLSGFQMFIVNKFFPEVMNVDFLPQNGSENIQEQNMNFVQEYQSILYMLTVPVYAMMSKIVFFDRKQYNYTEHLVVNMYLAAHLSIISSIIVLTTSALGFNFGIIGLFTIPLQILFSAYCFKRLFGLSFKTILLKTIFFILILIIVFIVLSIFSAIVMYFNGSFEELRKAKMNSA